MAIRHARKATVTALVASVCFLLAIAVSDVSFSVSTRRRLLQFRRSLEPSGDLKDEAKHFADLMPSGLGILHSGYVALLEKTCDIIFKDVDHDNSGSLNAAEIHVAVLMVHLRLGKMLGGLAIDLPRAAEVKPLMAAADVDGNGEITNDEFKRVFVQFFAQRILARVFAKLFIGRVVVPSAAIGLHMLQERVQEQWYGSRSEEVEPTLQMQEQWDGEPMFPPRQRPSARTASASHYTMRRRGRSGGRETKLTRRAREILGLLSKAARPILNVRVCAFVARQLHLESGLSRLLSTISR